MENYGWLINSISKSSGLGKEEIETKVRAKQEKISGLISKEGAAQIVAAELGVSLDAEKFKIEELFSGMRRVNTFGKIINLSPVRTFMRNGQESKVANLIIADETSNIKVVLWDTSHIGLIEAKGIMEGSIVEILNANLRENEIHLGSFSELKLSNEVLGDVKTERIIKEKKIIDFKNSDNVKVRAFIVQTSDLRFFNVCSECKRKVVIDGENFTCKDHGKVISEKRALMNLVLDDGTETIRSVLFHEKISDLGINQIEDFEAVNKQKQEIMGKEMIFSGSVRINKFFNNIEFIIDGFEEINTDDLILNLEKN